MTKVASGGLGSGAGQLMGSFLVNGMQGQKIVFFISIILSALIVVYACFFIAESHFPKLAEAGQTGPSWARRLARIFRLRNASLMYRLVMRKRKGRRQVQLWLIGYTFYFLFTCQ